MNQRRGFCLALAICLTLVVLAPVSLLAQKYVYVNNNISGPNSVTGFVTSVNAVGFTLLPIPGSPFPTGGSGGNLFFSDNEIAVFSDGQFLFAANPGSSNVAVFRINQSSGVLTPVPGSPFSTGQSANVGMSLAQTVAPGGKILYAANDEAGTISIFNIAHDGTLTLSPFSPVPTDPNRDGPGGLAVRSNGKFLAVALPTVNRVAVFAIGPAGRLTPVPGSPFAGTGNGMLAGVDFDCGENLLFGAEANLTETIVDVYSVTHGGGVDPIPGSPFVYGNGAKNSNVVLYSPAGPFVFVSNQFSGTVTDFAVASDGSLTPVAGAPFDSGQLEPAGMAVGSSGPNLLLYVVDPLTSTLAVLKIAADGTLGPVTGSPFLITRTGGPLSVALHPPLGCR
jgi:6-phosphogluconolactonase (cycloisomerase 2 family)